MQARDAALTALMAEAEAERAARKLEARLLPELAALAERAAALVPVPEAPVIDTAALAAQAVARIDLHALAREAAAMVAVPEPVAPDLHALAAEAAALVAVPEPAVPDVAPMLAEMEARLRGLVAAAQADAPAAPRLPERFEIDGKGDLAVIWSDGSRDRLGRVRTKPSVVRVDGGAALPPGAEQGQVLTAGEHGMPGWADPADGLPAGGTEGQVLTSDGAGGVAWADPSVSGTGISHIVALTQAEYDALSPPDATTLYVITDAA